MNIVICIPTYKRPALLNNLVISIVNSSIDKMAINGIAIVIVDNDIEKSAEETVVALKERFKGSLRIEYYNHPEKGLANVRNELLRKALLFRPEFIVFVDDDEYVSGEWLNELVNTITSNGGDMAMGPVIPVFENHVPANISCWFERPIFEKNHVLDWIATNNLIINVAALMKHQVWFDPRFNITGAEDSYFGRQLMKKGAKCFWSEKAVVYDYVPENRATIKWLVKRYFNGANTYTYILKLDKEYIKLTRKTIASLFYVLAGLVTSPAVILPLRRKYWGPLKFSEGIGAISALFSIKYYEYK